MATKMAIQMPKGFTKRLCENEGFSAKFARELIFEYKRFLQILALGSLGKLQGPFTPSKLIDVVWHLHIYFDTKAYHECCQALCGSYIHHKAGSGKKNEKNRFSAQYTNTLAAYQMHFGKSPRVSIWPNAKATKPQATARKTTEPKKSTTQRESGRTTWRLISDCGGCDDFACESGCSY